MRRRVLPALLARLRRDSRGVTVVEFALIAPILLTLYLAGFSLSDAIACQRKVTLTARTVSDLASRYSSMSATDADTVLAVSTQVLSPYNAARAQIRLSEVRVTSSTAAQVVWSRSLRGTPLTVGSSITLSANMAATGSYLILGETSYAFTPTFAFGAAQAMTLSDQTIMSPRLSDQVPLT